MSKRPKLESTKPVQPPVPKKPKPSFECIVCGINFAYKEIFNRHISTYHKGKPRKCLKCGKKVFDLNLHNRNKHPKETEFDEIMENTNENPAQIRNQVGLIIDDLVKKICDKAAESGM